MSVTLLEIWRAARARAVPFSGESAGHLALSLWDALASAPRQVDLGDAELVDDGSLRVVAGNACLPDEAERAVRALLGRLLEVASSPGPALFRAAARTSGTGLAGELAQALIPFNRAAARRALLRLLRETERAVANGQLGELPGVDDTGLLRLSPPAPAVHEVSSAAPPVASGTPSVGAREASAAPEVAPLLVASPAAPAAASLPVEPAAASPVPARVAAPVTDMPREAAPVPHVLRAASLHAAITAQTPLPATASMPEAEHVTRPEPVMVRRARSLPPPLPSAPVPEPECHEPASPEPESARHTPRMGSVDVAVISVPPRVLDPELLDTDYEATELVPPVRELDPEQELALAAKWPICEARFASERLASQGSAEPESACDGAELESPEALEESPALVVGVHVEDNDERAEPVSDDELETRPLPLPPEPPVGPIEPMLAPRSDVSQLLSGFQVGGGLPENELRRELKVLAGVDLTPGAAVAVRPR